MEVISGLRSSTVKEKLKTFGAPVRVGEERGGGPTEVSLQ